MLDRDPTESVTERVRALEAALKWGPKHRELARHLQVLMTSVDTARLDALRAQYADRMKRASADSRYKYFDVAYYTLLKLHLARQLGLDVGPPRRVLDIGTGAGHFPFVCRYFGHQVVGLDIENPVYEGIAGCLGIERRIVRVERETLLPRLGERFDLIVACGITFDQIRTRDRQRQPSYWSLAEWQFFLNDLVVNHLECPGRVFLSLNKQRRGRLLGFDRLAYDHALLVTAARNGAAVSRWKGTIDMSFPIGRRIVL